MLINGINILGGFIIGIAMRGMTFQDALSSYTILTIGDGLVSQIPALIISIAAGLVVTRSAAGTSLDLQIKTQLLGNPRVLGTVSGVVILFSIIPGMPTIPFLIIGIVLGVSSYIKNKKPVIDEIENVEEMLKKKQKKTLKNIYKLTLLKLKLVMV